MGRVVINRYVHGINTFDLLYHLLIIKCFIYWHHYLMNIHANHSQFFYCFVFAVKVWSCNVVRYFYIILSTKIIFDAIIVFSVNHVSGIDRIQTAINFIFFQSFFPDLFGQICDFCLLMVWHVHYHHWLIIYCGVFS